MVARSLLAKLRLILPNISDSDSASDSHIHKRGVVDLSGMKRALHTHIRRRDLQLVGVSFAVCAVVSMGVHTLFPDGKESQMINSALAASVRTSQESVLTSNFPRPALAYDPTPALGGADIRVSDGALLPSPEVYDPSDVHTPSHGHISIYTVREGDTLSEIADMFNVSINTIRWANDIRRDTGIHEGQNLVILPVSGVRHTVVSGDTLASVVKKYKGDMDEVLAFNELAAEADLSVGTVIVIPDGEIVTTVQKKKSSSTARGPIADTSGYFIRPITGGRRSQGIHGYNAVDLAAPSGTAIYAAAEGEVIISKSYGWNGGYGNYVVIKHPNGTQTLYSHNSSNTVSVGDYVAQGEVIGYVGSTGKSTGPHVHFEVRGATNPF